MLPFTVVIQILNDVMASDCRICLGLPPVKEEEEEEELVFLGT